MRYFYQKNTHSYLYFCFWLIISLHNSVLAAVAEFGQRVAVQLHRTNGRLRSDVFLGVFVDHRYYEVGEFVLVFGIVSGPQKY